MTAHTPRTCAEHSKLYKALLQNELTTYLFAEAAFNLLDAMEGRSRQQPGLPGDQLAEANCYARSMLEFVTENQKISSIKMRLARYELIFDEDLVHL